MPTLPNIGLVTPTQGGDSGTWTPKNIEAVNVDIEKLCSRLRYDFGCLVWTGAKNRQGYGVIRLRDGHTALVHRVMYSLEIGDLNGSHLDHLCRNEACCNPVHLEPVSIAENLRRGTPGKYLTERARCPNGHEYTPGNTRYKPGSTSRNCRQCGRDYHARKKQERS
jgi:hypothetical protein